jgi:hypothetical protein
MAKKPATPMPVSKPISDMKGNKPLTKTSSAGKNKAKGGKMKGC